MNEAAPVFAAPGWRGGMPGQPKENKPVDLSVFEPVLRCENALFINLQYGDCTGDLANFSPA